jgi:hypothetical protein
MCEGGPSLVRIDLLTKAAEIVSMASQPIDMFLTVDGRYLCVLSVAPVVSPYPATDQPSFRADITSSFLTVYDAATLALLSSISRPIPPYLLYSQILGGQAADEIILINRSGAEVIQVPSLTVTRTILMPCDASLNGYPECLAGTLVGDSLIAIDYVGAVATNLGTGTTTRIDLTGTGALGGFFFYVMIPDPMGLRLLTWILTDRGLPTGPTQTLAVYDAETLKLSGTVDVELGAAAFLNDGRVVILNGSTGSLVDLATLRAIPLPSIFGVAAKLSRDGKTLYVRTYGGVSETPFGATSFYFGGPVKYELAAVDVTSMTIAWRTTLSATPFTASHESPLALTADGRFLVAPNSAANTVTVLELAAAGRRRAVRH